MQLFKTFNYSVKGAFRISQTMRTLTKTGVSWIWGNRPPFPVLMRKTFEQLGSTYIKLGQFIASSPSLFPEDYVNEFQNCLDQTEPLPFDVMERVLEEDLGQPLSKIFSRIDRHPIASASIAQVHSARLVSGEEVVIKIQKPGVKDILLTDLNFIYMATKFLEFLVSDLWRASLSSIVEEIQKTMIEECDFLKEANNLIKFNEFLEDTGNVVALVPFVYSHATTIRVLTMERFYGVPLTDLDSIRKYTREPEKTLFDAMNTWFASLLFCDFFHADVHAGNLMVLEDGRIGFIDFGIVGRISSKTWSAVIEFMQAISLGDHETMAKSMLEIGMTSSMVDTFQLAADIKNLYNSFNGMNINPYYGQVADYEINQIMMSIINLGDQHGIRFPREFALLLKQFLYFDKYIQILAPELNIFNDSRLHLNQNLIDV